MKVSVDRVIEAAAAIARPYVRAPQYRSEGLSRLLGVEVILKVETVNPVGSVMGRAAEWWFECHPDVHRVISSSAGDFGTAIGRAGASRGIDVEVFGPLDADRAKVDALRHSGMIVRLDGRTADEARHEARRYASMIDAVLVDDGSEVELAEGAGTMAAELEHLPHEPHTVFVPMGRGTLARGTGSWCHERMPRTRVVGVSAEGARSEGAVAVVADSVDDVRLVTDDHLSQAAEALAVHEGLLVSLSGAAALAAAGLDAPSMRGAVVVVPVTSRRIG